MAEEVAGRLFIELLPDVSRKEFQAALKKATTGINVVVTVDLKIKPGAAKKAVAEGQAQLDKMKNKPELAVGLKIKKGAASAAVREANAHFKTLKSPPKLSAALNITATEVRRAITDANKKLKAAKTAPPKIKVQLDLDERKLALVNELRVKVKELDVTMAANPIEIPIELDAKTIKSIGAKAVLVASQTQAKVNALQEAGESKRQLIIAKSEAEIAAIGARAENSIRVAQEKSLIRTTDGTKARTSTLTSSFRQLRNDLSNFDGAVSKVLRRLTLGFGIFTAGVAASFATVTAIAVASFAKTELAVARASAVLASDEFVKSMSRGEDGAKQFGASLILLKKELGNLTEEVALDTVFNPTEIAEGAKALAQAGLSLPQIQKSLLPVAQFAQNQEIDLARSTELLTDSAFAAAVPLEKLIGLADKFTFVANATSGSAIDIAEAFSNKAAPSFLAYGQSIEQTLTVLELFAKSGVRGKTAGEQAGILIRFLSQASVKTKESEAAWKSYGIQIGKVNGKTVPLTTTLLQLSNLARSEQIAKGSTGVVKLFKTLGLTQKSATGLMQIMPQVLQQGAAGLAEMDRQVASSGNALVIQSQVINDTLGFQAEKFANSIGSLSRTAAGPLATKLTSIFKRLNGDVAGSVDLAESLRKKMDQIGQSVAERLGPAFERFAFGGEGAKFFSGIERGVKSTLSGISNAFVAFRTAMFGSGSNMGFFAVLGEVFARVGGFVERTLPRIAKFIGRVGRAFSENSESIRLFSKYILTIFLASKVNKYFLLPIASIIQRLGLLKAALVATSGAGVTATIVEQSRALLGLSASAKAAAASVTALSVAESGLSASSARAGAASAVPLLGKMRAAKPVALVNRELETAKMAAIAAGADKAFAKATARQAVLASRTGATAKVLGRFGDVLKAVGPKALFATKLLGKLSLVGTAIYVGFKFAQGFVEGFREQLHKSIGASEGAQKGLHALGKVVDAISAVFGTLGKAIVWIGKQFGKLFGSGLEKILIGIGKLADGFGWVAKQAKGLWSTLSGANGEGEKLVNISNSFGKTAEAAANIGRSAAEKYSASIAVLGVQTVGVGKRTTAFKDRSKNLAATLDAVANRTKNVAGYQFILAHSTRNADINMRRLAGGKGALDSLWAAVSMGSEKAARKLIALRKVAIITARDLRIETLNTQWQDLMSVQTDPAGKQIAGMQWVDAIARERSRANASLRGFTNEVGAALLATNDLFGKGAGDVGDGAGVGGALETVKTAAEKATDSVNKLSQAQLNKKSATLVARVSRSAVGGYKATAFEAEVLRRTLPALDAQLQKQADAVSKLDEALQSLQATQLKGTKAFSDQAFAAEQSIKTIQLQRLDLIIAGTPEEDAAIVELDKKLAALQQQTERMSLVEALQLDPLKRKLEDTFSPVKELGFDEIIKQFSAIQQQKAPITEAIAGGENLKTTLEAAISDAEIRFGDAGKQVTIGFANGIKGSTKTVTEAGRESGQAALAGVNKVMQFGSPSKTMIQRGKWVVDGFVIGMDGGYDAANNAGQRIMWGFVNGMKSVWMKTVRPFVLGIAEWIAKNKGPIAYDQQLLRPAGEAIMFGFKRGLTDGFGEIKGWVKKVGPSMGDDFPKDLFIKRSAKFLIGNAQSDIDFDPNTTFGDLLPDVMSALGINDPMLGFLHKTLSMADTTRMAQMLAGQFGVNGGISVDRRAGALTSAGNLSDHPFGTAADIGTGTGSPTPASRALFAAIKPLIGKIFKQIIHDGMGHGITGSFPDSQHGDHVHIAWLKAMGFSKLSGKFGEPMGVDIPGASSIVDQAIYKAAMKNGVELAVLAGLFKQESGFNPNAISLDGGFGLAQLTSPGLLAQTGGHPLDPFRNADVGARYLKTLLNQFGSVSTAVGAYNAGPGAVGNFPDSTRLHHIPNVMRFIEEFRRLFRTGNRRAQGGLMNASSAYHVNERGHELFIPGRGGTMISTKDFQNLVTAMQNQQAAGTGGQMVNDNRVVNVHSNSPNPAAVAAIVDARMRGQIVGVRR